MEYRNFIRLVGAMLLLSVVLTAFHGSQKRIESTIFTHLDPVVYVFLLLLIGVLMWIWPSKRKEDTDETEEPVKKS